MTKTQHCRFCRFMTEELLAYIFFGVLVAGMFMAGWIVRGCTIKTPRVVIGAYYQDGTIDYQEAKVDVGGVIISVGSWDNKSEKEHGNLLRAWAIVDYRK